MMELLLVRHGLPGTVHATGTGDGVDPPLTERGLADATRLGDHLWSRPDRVPDAVYTSPMLRARQTAAAIVGTRPCPLRVEDRLREFDHGADVYAPPEQAAPEVRARLWRALETGVWGEHRFDPDEFERTVRDVLADIVARHPGARVAVVCHAGVINSFVGAVLRRPRGMFFRPDYTSVSRVAASRDGRRELLSLNETGHLDPTRRSTAMTDGRLSVLHLLRLGGFVPADRLAERAGLPAADVVEILQKAAADGHATERTGRISGWTLTADGRAEHAALLAAELDAAGARPAVERGNDAFLQLNEPFKELCTRWQMLPDGTPNDHGDPDHDAAVLDDLGPLHERVTALTAELAEHLPRFGRYPTAFAAARDRLVAGEVRAFAAPMAESYHDAWMELHQDLLSTLGRERSTADGH